MFSSQNSQVSSDANYIEDVFSTYLYTGNGSTQTIANGIDLSGKGGMVWLKDRSSGQNHALSDTVRGTGTSKQLQSNTTSAATTDTLTGFTSSGFTLDASFGLGAQNLNTVTYASWTFRKQPKFFDVVTYTGANTSRMVSHSLGSTPGFVIIKKTSGTSNWLVAARDGTSSGKYTYTLFNSAAGLNLTAAANYTNYGLENSGWITSTGFNPYILSGSGGNDNNNYDYTGDTYIAYLFAHDAGGFGLTGTDNVISCGGFTTNGSGGVTVDLGYEPQWVFLKNTDAGYDSVLVDNMRGFPASGDAKSLRPESSSQEGNRYVYANATGFSSPNNLGANLKWVYIAIRRGPMKVPTSGTSVFYPNAYTGNSTDTTITSTGFPPDLFFSKIRQSDNGYQNMMFDKLRGVGQYLIPTSTGAEGASSNIQLSFNMTGVTLGVGSNVNNSGNTYAQWNFRRAPSFFDEVCWSSTGSAQTLNHNLGVVPELMIRKVRNGTWESWMVYSAPIGNTKILYLDQTAAEDTNNGWNNQTPTATQFFVNNTLSGYNFVTYLFATCAGVSKVGSYTGTGTTLQVNCGFTGGARFVLIKRTDSTGGWYVWDSARGIVSGNDPYLLLNSTAAEVTSTDYIDTYSAGFEISSTAPAAINASGGTFIFLAIA